jgi:hypothetical protein
LLTVNLLIQKEPKIGSTLPLAPGHGTIKGKNATCFCCRMIGLHHRIDRVLGFFSSRPKWDPPLPHPQTSVTECLPPFSNRKNWDPNPSPASKFGPPPFGSAGGGVPIRTRGHCGTLGTYVLCLLYSCISCSRV